MILWVYVIASEFHQLYSTRILCVLDTTIMARHDRQFHDVRQGNRPQGNRPRREMRGPEPPPNPFRDRFISISVLLFLLAILYLVVKYAESSSPFSLLSSSSRVMESACNITLYPELCISTLLSYSIADRESPKNFAYMTLNLTMTQTQEAYGVALKLDPDPGNSMEKEALALCKEMLRDSIICLKHTLAETGGMGVEPSNAQTAKIHSWLNEVVKKHHTCSEWLQDWGSAVTVPLQERSHDLSKSTTNAMYLLNISCQEADTFHVPYPFKYRRLLPWKIAIRETPSPFQVI